MASAKHPPVISIIMPAHNYGSFLPRSIKSVIRQTYPHWQLIIVDDASRDQTPSIMQHFHQENILCVRNAHQLGVDKSIDRGFLLASGDYICLLAADDWLPPKSLEIRLHTLQKKHVEVVHAALTRIGHAERTLVHPLDVSNLQDLQHFLARTGISPYGINSATFLWCRHLLARVGLRSALSNPFHHNDYEYALKLLSLGTSTPLDVNVYNYSIHPHSLSAPLLQNPHYWHALKQLETKYLSPYSVNLA